MIVRSILKSKGAEVETVAPDATIIDVARTLRAKRIGAVIVLDSERRIKGVLSERDIVRGICEFGGAVLEKSVGDLMTSEVICCGLDDSITDIMGMMTGRRIRHVPVVENGQLQGIISIGDVVKGRMSETELEAQALKEYIVTG